MKKKRRVRGEKRIKIQSDHPLQYILLTYGHVSRGIEWPKEPKSIQMKK